MFLPVALVVALFIINWILQPTLFRPAVFRINMLTFSPLMLMAAGQAIIMIGGNLDLSVGFGVSLINVIVASQVADSIGRNALVLVIALAAAVAMGIINGVIVGYLRVPSFIGTFASSWVWYGVAIMVRPTPGGDVTRGFIRFFKHAFGPINVILIIIIVTLLAWFILKKYKLGRYIYATGSNREAAYRNGINVKRITLAAFAIGWVCIYLGTLVLTAQTRSGDARIGEPFLLNSIAAAVVGGVAMAGGRGSPAGAALGAISLSIIMNIIYFARIPTSWQDLVRGVIIIIALGTTVLYKRKYD
jgi:ribose transport system permease protein